MWNSKQDKASKLHHRIAKRLPIAGISILSLLGFAKISTKLIQNKYEPFRIDVRIMKFLNSNQTPGRIRFMKFITSLASEKVLPIFASGLTYIFARNKKYNVKALEIPTITIGSELINLLIKERFKRVRPKSDIKAWGWSYPSGHSMEAISFYGFLIHFLYKNKHRIYLSISGTVFFSVLIFLIGLSRCYLKVHYPSDVAAGFLLGFLWLMGNVNYFKIIETVK